MNPFYEHSSAGGAKVKGGVEVKEEGQEKEGGTKPVGTPFPNKLLPSPNQTGLERELFQIGAGYKLELGAMIAPGCLLGCWKRLTYG